MNWAMEKENLGIKEQKGEGNKEIPCNWNLEDQGVSPKW